MSTRKPGLWFSARKVEIEDIKKAHRAGCCGCGKLPKKRRLKVVDGSGRHQVARIFCATCGLALFLVMAEELHRAGNYLFGSADSIRSDDGGSGSMGMDSIKAAAKARKKKREQQG